MISNRVERDVELLCDVFVRLSSGKVAKDLSFTSSEAFADRTAPKACEHTGKFGRTNYELATCDRAYRRNDVTRRSCLFEESGASSIDSSGGKIVTVSPREHHDLRRRPECEDVSSPLAAIAVRQVK